jgi:hypothetical protein
VANGTWTVGVNSGGGDDSLPGNYLDPANQSVVISNNNVTANFIAILATNTISGSLMDNSGNPIAGVLVWANATINGVNYNQDSVDTDANGNYSLNVFNGTWTVNVSSGGDSNPLPGNYLCPASQTVVISNNNAAVNFTAPLATNYITGNVKANGTNIVGVGVWASATINSVGYFQYMAADGSGNYQYPGNQNVAINNNNGTANFTVQPCGGVIITTTSLPAGQVNVHYDQFLQGSSCSGTLNWSLNDPQDFPSSLGWSGNGEIQGTPNTRGTYDFSVHLDDGNGHSTNQALSLTIYSATPVTIVLESDASTLAAALGPGVPSDDLFNQLDSGDISGLNFQAADVGAFGTDTPIPGGAPSGTQVINIPPGDGENGFFKISFVLPVGFQAIQLAGAANVDDYGRAFLNGNPISPSMSSDDSGLITEFGDAQFSTTNAAFFQVGTNELVIADDNIPGGSSGAAFYATISFQAGPSTPPPSLGSPAKLFSGQFQFLLNGMVGQNYTIQMSTNLSFTNWATLLITNNATTNSFNVIDPNATNNQRFYRIKVGP